MKAFSYLTTRTPRSRSMANDRSIFNYQAQADVYFVSMSIYKDLSLSTAMMMSKRTNDR